jgi:hypothetical protein
MALPSLLTMGQDGVKLLGVYAGDDFEDAKGDRDCDDFTLNASDVEGPPPCRGDDSFQIPEGDGGGTGSTLPPPSPPEQESPSSGPGQGDLNATTTLVGDNRVTVDIYVAFPAGKRSLSHVVAIALTDYWNRTDADDFVMHGPNVDPPPTRRTKRQRSRILVKERLLMRKLQEEEEEEEDDDDKGPFNLTEAVGHAVAHSTANETANTTWWDMYYVAITPFRLEAAPDASVWWWSYHLKYACFWGNSRKAVRNETVLRGVTNDLTNSIVVGQASGDFYAFLSQNYPYLAKTALNVTTVRPPDYDTDDLFTAPVDPRAWNWTRYAGLGVFCGTVVVTAVLMHLAAYRHRRLYKHECWSNVNLGNEKGVEEILQMGWKLKGAQMEIYDKTKLGYSDDNSLFLGGFEQREPCGLGEITVTHPTEASESHTRVDL